MNTKLRSGVKRKKTDDKLPFNDSLKVTYNSNLLNNDTMFDPKKITKLNYTSSTKSTKSCKTPVKLHSKFSTEDNFNNSFASLKSRRIFQNINDNFYEEQKPQINLDNIENIQFDQNLINAVQSNYNLSKDFVLTSEGLKKVIFPTPVSDKNFNDIPFFKNISSTGNASGNASGNDNLQINSGSFSYRQNITLTSDDEGFGSSVSGSHKKFKHSNFYQSYDENNFSIPISYDYNSFKNDEYSFYIDDFINSNDKSLVCPDIILRNVRCCHSSESWDNMIKSENLLASRLYYFQKQKYISPKTRSILFGWLAEVCDAFKIQRETYYLAINYVDRYLSVINDVKCNQLQLIGITSLYIAAKLEEIYPPRLHRFVNVTDGATNMEQVLLQEFAIVKALKWQLNEMTSYSWLALFVLSIQNQQSPFINRRTHPKTRGHERRISNRVLWQMKQFEFPTIAFKEIINITKLLEVVILDSESLKYPSIVLAASVFFIANNYDQSVMRFTGLSFQIIESCVRWMNIYSGIIRVKKSTRINLNSSQLSSLSASSNSLSNSSFTIITLNNDENYNVQKHRDAIKYLENCQERAKSDQSLNIPHNEMVKNS